MTHVVHPYAHRLGILRDWKSRWFKNGPVYRDQLRGDTLLREYLTKRLRSFYIALIEIERNGKMTKVIISSSRPGMIIGRQGEGSLKLKNDIEQFARKKKLNVGELKIEVTEVRSPESNAAVVAYMIAEGLERRLAFRRVLKQTMDKVMANRQVKGARFALSGRLGGAEMGRREALKQGNIPLQTLRADVDFAREKAYLPYGVIGVKVWIYKGEVFEKSKEKPRR
ncbi:MAG: 30S ribosomal protein S3 [Parcubacteria group bacterium]|nr:30S ribosomal protein S3 [Parcubacteria group bacterium]